MLTQELAQKIIEFIDERIELNYYDLFWEVLRFLRENNIEDFVESSVSNNNDAFTVKLTPIASLVIECVKSVKSKER